MTTMLPPSMWRSTSRSMRAAVSAEGGTEPAGELVATFRMSSRVWSRPISAWFTASPMSFIQKGGVYFGISPFAPSPKSTVSVPR